jgi:Na+-translocating ferredoxin:NAD+ oxidoreductase subunit B
MSNINLIEAIDTVLPQTQCGLCGYAGCRPYAEAMALKSEHINLCLPGGVKTLQSVAALLNQDPTPYEEEMANKSTLPKRVVIRESECIGCTKCIQACPVDAIVGSSKKIHTVVARDCTGCELCIAPCPVDCIDRVLIDFRSDSEQQEKSHHWRARYVNRQKRLSDIPLYTKKTILEVKKASKEELISSRRHAIQAAVARSQAKKVEHKT